MSRLQSSSCLRIGFLRRTHVDHSAVNFNESPYTLDLNLYRGGNIVEASFKTIGIGGAVSPARAGFTAMHGAIIARSGKAISIGAAIGPVVGLGIGASDAIDDHDQETLGPKYYGAISNIGYIYGQRITPVPPVDPLSLESPK